MKYLVLIFLFSSSFILAQQDVHGTVTDEKGNSLPGATIVLLENQDSSMVAFSISNEDGYFRLENINVGTYILQMSFVSYATQHQTIRIEKSDNKTNIGTYKLEPIAELLQEVTVKAEHIPMGILGDTISYNAAAFQTKPGATVEDLLKQLPGVEVQRDGSIKAMGEEVNQILVDGKEFFGKDPKIATRNLEAEAVDKVEVFDKQSEIAEFTGIEDGDEEKTINLKLKEGYKTGGFGRAEMAAASKERYRGKLNFNRFSPSIQSSIIVSANNVNEQAFSFNEYIQFMGGLGNAISSSGGINSFNGSANKMAPQGLNNNISSGLNFNVDLSNKLKLTSHYFYNQNNLDLIENQISQEFTDLNDFDSQDNTATNGLDQNHRLNAKLNFKINPFNQIIWKNKINGILSNKDIQANTITSQLNTQVSQTQYATDESNIQLGYEGSLQYRKRFDKKGRNWISSLDYQNGRLTTNNSVLNEYLFNKISTIINQEQEYQYRNSGINIQSNYTEPLGNQHYLGIKFNTDVEKETPEKLFFDIIDENNQLLNEELSRAYQKTNTINSAHISIKKNAKKYKINSTLGAQWTSIDGQVNSIQESANGMKIENNSFFILPSFNFDYDVSKHKSIRFNYSTSVNLPTLSQLAPLPDNTNPNFLVLGNPNLSPEYVHTLSVDYRMFDMFNFKNLFFSLRANFIKDPITTEITIDEQLVRILKPTNTKEFTQVTGYASYSAPIRPLKINIRTNGNYSLAQYTSFINNTSSDVSESNVNWSLSFNNKSKEYIDVSTGISIDYNQRKYKINQDFNQNFFNYSLFVEGIIELGKGWSLSSKYDHKTYSSAMFSEGQNYNLWNASLKKIFSENKYAISISIYDILDQNIGLSRSGGANGLYESRYNTLSQYFMISFGMKLGKKKSSKGMIP